MRGKILSILALILALVAIAAGVWFYYLRPNPDELRLPGVVEMQEVRLGSKVGGRVIEVKAAEGDVLEENQPLLVFDMPELEAQRKQLKARLDQAKADFEKAENGPLPEEKEAAHAAALSAESLWLRVIDGARPEDIRQAKSEVEASEADVKLAREDFKRVDNLHNQGAVAQADYDTARATLDRSQRRLAANQAKLDLLEAGSRWEDIHQAHADMMKAEANDRLMKRGTRDEDKAAAKARVDEAQGKLDELDANLKEAIVCAPNKAVLEVLAVRKGDVVPPNSPIMRVLSAEDLWIKVYVPETELGRVRLGQAVKVTIDAYPGEELDGTVIQRAAASEFTPRNVQSADERKHQVFGVKVRVPDPHGILNSGMAATVVIPLQRLEK
jgi:multidrug resistance efflux pump